MVEDQGATPHELFKLGDFELASGTVLPDAHIAYATYGTLSEARDNVIVLPTYFTSTHTAHEWLVGPGEALDTNRYFVVIPSLFGNGLSSSPSNTAAPFDRGRFPTIDIRDNVRAQHRLLTERFEATGIELVIGGSMGALTAFQWGLSHPDLVERIMPICGAAKTSEHTYAFTWGVRAALEADSALAGGDYDQPPLVGLKALGRVYSAWGVPQAFYRERRYREIGHETVDDFISDFWEAFFASLDANNLISQLKTWQSADLSRTPGYDGDLRRALGDIRARAFLVPAQQDLYFPPEDSEWEAAQMPDAEVHVIPGVWGHVSGMGIDPACSDFIRRTVRKLLGRQTP